MTSKKSWLPIAFATILSCLIAPESIADDDSGFYIGGGVNRTSATMEGLDTSDNNPSVSVGLMLSNHFGLDLTVHQLQDSSENGTRIKVHGGSLSGVLNLPLAEHLDIYGKAGVSRIRAEIENLDNLGIDTVEETETEFAWAAGMKIDFGHHNLFAEYSVFSPHEIDLKTIYAGYRFEFN